MEDKKIIGRDIISFAQTRSTNDLAKEYALKGAKEGTVILSDCQTGGKGRMGRSFFSPRDKGIYMSVILRPKIAADESLLITSFAAVALARAVEKECGVSPKIKWVNDLYLGNKKICGILTEAIFENGVPKLIILGIGINVKVADFPNELSEIATSIENETGKAVSRKKLTEQILLELDKLYKTFKDKEFLEESRKRSNVIGKNIKVIRGDECYDAKAVGIDDTGGLMIENCGEQTVLYSGEVSIRLAEEK